jgi:hypothetical protein
MNGRLPDGHVVVFDDDDFYCGSVTADLLRQHGRGVVHMTAGDIIAPFTQNNLAYPHIRKRMVELGIEAQVSRNIAVFDGKRLTVEDVWTHRRHELEYDALVDYCALARRHAMPRAAAARGGVDRSWHPHAALHRRRRGPWLDHASKDGLETADLFRGSSSKRSFINDRLRSIAPVADSDRGRTQ